MRPVVWRTLGQSFVTLLVILDPLGTRIPGLLLTAIAVQLVAGRCLDGSSSG
jgi:small neutral amino acid transporter SnatA (MarC family)